MIDGDKLLICPEDPTPHFPDSWYYDYDLYPPNHTRYYQDGRHAAINPSRYEAGAPTPHRPILENTTLITPSNHPTTPETTTDTLGISVQVCPHFCRVGIFELVV